VHLTRFGTVTLCTNGASTVNNTTTQHSTLATDLGCRFLPDGAVEVDEFGRTSVPGVFAVGDMAHRATVPTSLSAVIVASAAGAVAACFIDQPLTEDTALPDQFSAPA
jgi:thioredoxin reductase